MKTKTIRRAARPLAALLLLWTVAVPARGISAKSAIVMDGASGKVLFAQNADEKSLIASTTKIMTGLLIARDCALDEPVTVDPAAAGTEGSSLYLRPNEETTVEALLYGLLLHSGNDAALALAIHHSGSEAAFVAHMNETAAQLGLANTHFANPHGLDSEENYSTALDLARLAAHAMDDPLFHRVVSTRSIRFGDRCFSNHNKLLWRYPGAVGVKTGYTKAAGRILVSAAERNGRRLIAVTISDPNDWADHAALLDRGFAAYQKTQLCQAGDPVGFVPVLTDGSYARVAFRETLTVSLAPGETPTLRLFCPKLLFSPAAPGAAAGYASVCLHGKELARAELIFQ